MTLRVVTNTLHKSRARTLFEINGKSLFCCLKLKYFAALNVSIIQEFQGLNSFYYCLKLLLAHYSCG